MTIPPELPIQQKVFADILRTNGAGKQLLVYVHVDFPEAGILVPGGSVKLGEDLYNAVFREILEEMG